MIPDDLEALALADAIGALDPEDRLVLDARIAALSPEERAHVASLYDVTLALGSGVDQADPPARVRDHVIAATRTPGRYTVFGGDQEWADTPLPGIQSKVLSIDKARGVVTLLIRAQRGRRVPVAPPLRPRGVLRDSRLGRHRRPRAPRRRLPPRRRGLRPWRDHHRQRAPRC